MPLSQDARPEIRLLLMVICEVQIVAVEMFLRLNNPRPIAKVCGTVAASGLMLALGSLPVLAHHPFGGQLPRNFFEGFLSGLGHPVIGIDHLTFVIAVGLMAGLLRYGLALPLIFMATAIAGTGFHLLGVNLPFPELIVAASVLLLGGLLAVGQPGPPVMLMALVGVAGMFHGYAYGEAIVGAQMNPLVAYLWGFSVIQGAIAYGAYGLSRHWRTTVAQGSLNLRFAGFLITGLGLAFTAAQVLG